MTLSDCRLHRIDFYFYFSIVFRLLVIFTMSCESCFTSSSQELICQLINCIFEMTKQRSEQETLAEISWFLWMKCSLNVNFSDETRHRIFCNNRFSFCLSIGKFTNKPNKEIIFHSWIKLHWPKKARQNLHKNDSRQDNNPTFFGRISLYQNSRDKCAISLYAQTKYITALQFMQIKCQRNNVLILSFELIVFAVEITTHFGNANNDPTTHWLTDSPSQNMTFWCAMRSYVVIVSF